MLDIDNGNRVICIVEGDQHKGTLIKKEGDMCVIRLLDGSHVIINIKDIVNKE